MDINDILDSLGLDLSDPEAKRGAVEAIEAILDSRVPDESGDGVGFGGGETDVEIDPDLIRPSKKHASELSDTEIEIEDEEDILNQIKVNDSEDDLDLDNSSNSSGDNEIQSNSSSKKSDNSDTEADSDFDIDNESGDNSEDSTKVAKSEEDSDDLKKDKETDFEADDAEGSNELEDDEPEGKETTSKDNSDIENNKDSDELDDSTLGGQPEEEGTIKDEDSDKTNESEFDEDDLLDDEIKDLYKDKDLTAKQEARKIKRERTLLAAKETLAKAKNNKVAPALIRELEKSIAALEELTEAPKKSIKDMSDEEFNLVINRVFDAIDAIGNSGLTYTTDEERKLRAQEIKNDLKDAKTQAELSAEDVAQIRAENQAVKARERENNKFKRRGRGSFKGFQDFLNSLYRAIALQVHTNEIQDDSWSAINRRHGGTSVLQPGKKIQELPDKKIPVIDFYFDQSGSWSERDLRVGEEAVARLADMEEKGQIKINIYYFANHVYTDAQSARWEGGTMAWNDIVKNIITTQATNVIIMTDGDMEDRWEKCWDNGVALNYTVPGYVWYLWRDGENAPRLPRDLKGRGGTQQFSFSS